MKKIAVFCGASTGKELLYKNAAIATGKALATNEITVVYGGAKIGMMGFVADGALQNQGKVIGVIPHFLSDKEVIHSQLTELIQTRTMHERKLKMHDLSDGFIALPGGFGTFEELFEIVTWAQLGLHKKPIGLLNVNGFYNPLIAMIQQMQQTEFLSAENAKLILVDENINGLLAKMNAYVAPPTPKWIDLDKV